MSRAIADESRPRSDLEQPLREISPTRIAFCITDLQRGGAEQNLCRLVLGLDRRRWQPAVFCLSSPQPLAEVIRRAGIPVCCIAARHRWDVGVLARLARQLRRWKPKLLQTFLFHANLAGRLAGQWAGVPVIVSGARVAERRARWPLILDNLTTRLSQHSICVSRGVARWLQHKVHWPASRLSVIPNGVPLETLARADAAARGPLGIPSDAFLILFVGRLDEQKGLTDLFHAFSRLRDELPQAHLLLVGQGPLDQTLRHRAQQLQLTSRIHFAGWRDDVPQLLKAADLLALPSLWEGMPNVVLEAMAAELPVVATAVEGVEELLIPEQTGCLIPVGDRQAFAQAVVRLARSPELRLRVARAAKARILEGYTVQHMVAAYQQRYEALLAQARRLRGR